jgi:copper transport protein
VRDADPERTGLRRSVLAEAAVAAVLLAVTTTLTNTAPARTEQTAQVAAGTPDLRVSVSVPFASGGKDGRGTGRITIDRVGNTLDVRLTRPDGRAFDAEEVEVAFTLPAEDIGPLLVQTRRAGADRWSASGVQIPMTGDWQVSLTVRTSDSDHVTETKSVKIK